MTAVLSAQEVAIRTGESLRVQGQGTDVVALADGRLTPASTAIIAITGTLLTG